MMERVCLPVVPEPGAEVAARLPGPQPEHLHTQAQLQTGSPRDHVHNLLHPGFWVLRGRAGATAMLPGAWAESQSATPRACRDTGEAQLPSDAPSHRLPAKLRCPGWLGSFGKTPVEDLAG